MKTLSSMSNLNVVKMDNTYVFLATPRFKFLDVRNYLAPGLSYSSWCKANRCVMKTCVPYRWMNDNGKLTHVGPVMYKTFYSSFKGGSTITHDKYNKLV